MIEHNAVNLAYGEPISIAPPRSRYLFWGVVVFLVASGVLLVVGRYPVEINAKGYVTYEKDGVTPIALVAVPARYKKLIKVGQKILIHYDNFPYQKYGSYKASIKDIGNHELMSKRLSNDLTMPDQLIYPVYASLDRGEIKQGGFDIKVEKNMSFTAKIKVENKRLIWVVFSSL